MATSIQAMTEKLIQQLQQQGGQSQTRQQQRLLQEFQQQQQQGGQTQFQQQAGNVKVYTGPKDGKFIINNHGKKVYIDRKSLNTNLQYQKAAKPKAKKVAKKAKAAAN